jgi:hypothetical protein
VPRRLEGLGEAALANLDHAGIELTEAAFAFRDRVHEGTSLLAQPLRIDLSRASRRGGPRAYLHTAGVAAADRFGTVVSSLLSVFDDFGSGVFVPEGGFVLNNRAGGFTAAPNDARPGKRPVHTLAPMLIETERGALALATPGADGQSRPCSKCWPAHSCGTSTSPRPWRRRAGGARTGAFSWSGAIPARGRSRRWGMTPCCWTTAT